MKKKYSLDYDLIYADERCDAVAAIIDELDTNPNETDLEQMADYILFGKNDKLVSAVDTKDITVPKRRFNSFATKAEQDESLDELLSDPTIAQDIECNAKKVGPENKSPYKVIRPEIRRTKYDSSGNIIEYGDDFDNYGNPIPFMRELWASIDKWQERYDMYCGRKEPNEWVMHHPKTKYQLYKMQHFLIELRREQYYIKDVYNPTLHFFNVQKNSHSKVEYLSDTGVWLSKQEWCARKRNPKKYDLPQPALQDAKTKDGQYYWKLSSNEINYEDSHHILALMDNYVRLLKKCYPHPDSDLRHICWDLERLVDNADLTELEYFLFVQRIAHRNIFQIQKALAEEHIVLTDATIRRMMRMTIPKKIAKTATRLRIESEAATGKRPSFSCLKCGTTYPLSNLYFTKANDKRTGYTTICKECQKKSRQHREAVRRGEKVIEVKI